MMGKKRKVEGLHRNTQLSKPSWQWRLTEARRNLCSSLEQNSHYSKTFLPAPFCAKILMSLMFSFNSNKPLDLCFQSFCKVKWPCRRTLRRGTYGGGIDHCWPRVMQCDLILTHAARTLCSAKTEKTNYKNNTCNKMHKVIAFAGKLRRASG